MNSGPYPVGFLQWSAENRNAYFAQAVRDYDPRKAAPARAPN